MGTDVAWGKWGTRLRAESPWGRPVPRGLFSFGIAALLVATWPALSLVAHNPPKCKPCCDDQESGTSPCKGEPAHLGAELGGTSGNVYTERGEFYQRATDLVIPGRPGAESMVQYAFRRHYRSRIDDAGPLGHNWEHNYFERLRIRPSDGSVFNENGLGRDDFYRKTPQGGFTSPPELFTRLSQNPDGSFTLLHRGGSQKRFDAAGKLLEIRDRFGNSMTFHHDAQDRLVRVNDTLGRDVLYRYRPDGKLQEVQDYIGRRVRFTYDADGDLVSVTGPAVVGTPTGNDFPQGKTTRYTYSSGFADPRLNHNLLTITRPREVAAGGPPVLINEYGTDPALAVFDRLLRQTYGGTNASGVPAGGTFSYVYTPRPGGDDETTVLRTRETDRNGNVEEYEYNDLGYPTVRREFTNRDVRPSDPPVFETRMSYNADGQLLRIVFPQGNSIEYTYDSANPDRLAQGNLLRERRVPDPGRGGDQAALVTTYTYEPRFNQVKTITDPRGNDPSFVPPNGGGTSPTRYTTTFTFDYEVGAGSCGKVVRKQEPTARQPQVAPQTILTDYTYNQFCQLTSEADPEGNVDDYLYFPSTDPDGDGDASPGTRPGLSTTTGGYLREKIVDSRTSPRRTESAPPAAIRHRFFYDPVGNVVRTIDGRGNDVLSFVNQLNQVVRTHSEAPFRYVTDTFYDFNDNVVRTAIENEVVSDVDGKPRFTGDGNFATGTGTPAFFVHRFTYDILDNLVQKDEDATGSTPSRLITRYRYDANENLVRETFPEGNALARTYDERDLPFTETRGFGSPAAATLTYGYDRNRNLVLVLDAEDNNADGRNDPTTFVYDGFDRQVASIDAVGNELAREYDPADNVVGEAFRGRIGGPSPGSNSTAGNVLLSERLYRHDELNRVFQRDDRLFIAAGVTTVRPPVLNAGPLVPGDGAVTTRFVHDRNSRPVREIQADLDTRITEYDGVDRVVSVVDPVGNSTTHRYDANDNVVETTEREVTQKAGVAAESFVTLHQYDALDRPTRTTDNCGNTDRLAYDSRDNLTHLTDAKADAALGCPGTTNAQGNSTRYAYDGMSRRLQTVEDLRAGGLGSRAVVDQITTTLSWDGNDRLRSLTDDNGNQTRYAYDALDRNRTETKGFCVPPALADRCDAPTTITMEYDRDDNMVRREDENGSVSTCDFDAINRLVACRVRRGAGVTGTTAVSFEYDGLSRVTRTTDDNDPAAPADDSTVRTAYDALSRIVEQVQNGQVVGSEWFGGERRRAIVYPNGRRIEQGFDALDRVTAIGGGGALDLATYDYIGPERVLERRYANGTRLTYLDGAGTKDVGYDGAKRTVVQRHVDAANSLIAGFTHPYDREHNRAFEEKLHDRRNGEQYEYDSAYRLVSFERDAGGMPPLHDDWVLDGAGNWKSVLSTATGTVATETRRHSSFNEIVERRNGGVTAIAHDANGNVVDDGTRRYTWDYLNRLRTVTRKADGAVLAAYSYDALNRRIRKVVESSGALDGVTAFFYDGWRVIEERTSPDVPAQQFVYGVYVDEPLVLDRNRNGDRRADGSGDERLFYHQNVLFSTFALTDAGGTVVERYQYDAYGYQTVFGPAFTPTIPGGASVVGNPYTFTGQRFDPETGLMYYKNRYHSTELGRLLSRDPIGYATGANLYEYVESNPVNWVDPSGLRQECESKFIAVSGGPPIWKKSGGSGSIINFFTANYDWDLLIEFRHTSSSAGATAEAEGDVAYAFSWKYHDRHAKSTADGVVTCDCDESTDKCTAGAQGGEDDDNDNEYSSAVVVVGEASGDKAKLTVTAAVSILGQITIKKIAGEVPVGGGATLSPEIEIPQTAKASKKIGREYTYKCVKK